MLDPIHLFIFFFFLSLQPFGFIVRSDHSENDPKDKSNEEKGSKSEGKLTDDEYEKWLDPVAQSEEWKKKKGALEG